MSTCLFHQARDYTGRYSNCGASTIWRSTYGINNLALEYSAHGATYDIKNPSRRCRHTHHATLDSTHTHKHTHTRTHTHTHTQTHTHTHSHTVTHTHSHTVTHTHHTHTHHTHIHTQTHTHTHTHTYTHTHTRTQQGSVISPETELHRKCVAEAAIRSMSLSGTVQMCLIYCGESRCFSSLKL
jgi:hypothetical protein